MNTLCKAALVRYGQRNLFTENQLLKSFIPERVVHRPPAPNREEAVCEHTGIYHTVSRPALETFVHRNVIIKKLVGSLE